MHYLLFYEADADYAERRAPYRALHVAHCRQAVARGELMLGGGLGEPPEGAVLLFRGSSSAVAEAFAAADPYVTSGVVRRWHVKPWATVVGPGAEVALPKDL
jgi:uncharacterized protein YciI